MSRALLLALCSLGGAAVQDAPFPNALPPIRVLGAADAKAPLFSAPRSAAVGIDGLLYVADTGLHRVRVLGPDGSLRRSWGARGGRPGEFRFPAGIAVGPDGRVFVADTGNCRVQVFDPEGRGPIEWPARFPAAVAVSAGRVAVVEPDLHQVRLLTTKGEPLRTIGGFGDAPGLFNEPADASFDEQGRLFVADANNHRIQAFDLEGRPVACWGSWGIFSGFLNHPGGLACANGLVYVADTGNHRIQVFDPAGTLKRQWGGGPLRPRQADGRLHGPTDIAVAPGFAVVCEPLEDRLQLFPPGNVPPGPRIADTPWWDRGGSRPVILEGDTPSGPIRTPETSTLVATVDPDAHALFFTDVTRNTSSRLVARAGGLGARLGLFNRPSDAAMDPAALRAFVSDRGHRRLQVLELSRDPSRPFGAGGRVRAVASYDFPRLVPAGLDPEIAVPGALALDGKRRLYVVDTPNAAVLVFDADMTLLRALRPPADPAAPPPRWEAVAPAPDGSRVYVADANAGRVLVFDGDGKVLGSWGGPDILRRPSGLAVDETGTVHVADALLHEILAFSPEGKFLRRTGGPGTDPGLLRTPGAIAFQPPCHLLVDDAGNHMGQVFTPGGKSAGFFLKAGYPPPGVRR